MHENERAPLASWVWAPQGWAVVAHLLQSLIHKLLCLVFLLSHTLAQLLGANVCGRCIVCESAHSWAGGISGDPIAASWTGESKTNRVAGYSSLQCRGQCLNRGATRTLSPAVPGAQTSSADEDCLVCELPLVFLSLSLSLSLFLFFSHLLLSIHFSLLLSHICTFTVVSFSLLLFLLLISLSPVFIKQWVI